MSEKLRDAVRDLVDIVGYGCGEPVDRAIRNVEAALAEPECCEHETLPDLGYMHAKCCNIAYMYDHLGYYCTYCGKKIKEVK